METRHGSGKTWPINQSASHVVGALSGWCHMEGSEPQWTTAYFRGVGGVSRASTGEFFREFLSLMACWRCMGSQTHTFEIQWILFYRKWCHFFLTTCWNANIILLKKMLTVVDTNITWIVFGGYGNIFMSFIINFITSNSSSGAVHSLLGEFF